MSTIQTIGLIGAGHIGSQLARLAVSTRLSRRAQQLARTGDARGSRRRAGPECARRDAGRSRRSRRHRRRHVPLKNYRERAGRAARGQDRHRYEQLLPAARRAHRRARQRVDDDGRAAAGATCRRRKSSRRSITSTPPISRRRTAGGLEEPPRAGHRRRRCRGEVSGGATDRSVRLRRRRRGPL